MSEAPDADVRLPFPIEFVIRDTPRSHQTENKKARQAWKDTVNRLAKGHAAALMQLYFLDDRPLAVTIYYFPPAKMQGDVENIVKLLNDGMEQVMYPEDAVLERVTVQKFEPGVEFVFDAPTPVLAEAIDTEPPVIYIRIDDDLGWRQVR